MIFRRAYDDIDGVHRPYIHRSVTFPRSLQKGFLKEGQRSSLPPQPPWFAGVHPAHPSDGAQAAFNFRPIGRKRISSRLSRAAAIRWSIVNGCPS